MSDPTVETTEAGKTQNRNVRNSGEGPAEVDMDMKFGIKSVAALMNILNRSRRIGENRSGSTEKMIEEKLYHDCGYPRELSCEDYRDMYDRFGPAQRVVNILPDESWQSIPEVCENEDPEDVTEFEQAWKDTCKGLRGKSWFKGGENQSNPMWEHLRRADRLSGIGSFGVVLLGLDDGLPLDIPAAGLEDDGYPSEEEPTKKGNQQDSLAKRGSGSRCTIV